MSTPDLFVCNSDGVDYFILVTKDVNRNFLGQSLIFITVFRLYREVNNRHVTRVFKLYVVVQTVVLSHMGISGSEYRPYK